MPLFEFSCKSCDDVVEILVRSPSEQVECPRCGNEKLDKLMSAPSAPAIKNGAASLPVAPRGESCGAPRCCGGGCDL